MMTNAGVYDHAGKKWRKMGIELEGGWNSDYRRIAEKVPGAQAKTDGSVRTEGYVNGEIITKPHTNLGELIADMRVLYPHHVNHTCGFHIHTSFSEIDTSTLADERFWHYFQDRWEKWGKKTFVGAAAGQGALFWERFNGRTREGRQQYCKAVFKPAEQLVNHADRYTQLNFVSYHKYQTIECRLLPMFNEVGLAEAALYELADMYDVYLTENRFPDIKLEREVVFDEEGVKEVHNVRYPDTSPIIREYSSTGPAVTQGPDVFYAFPEAEGAMELLAPFGRNVRGA